MNESKNPHAVALGKLGGKKGGASKTIKKANAARANGRLGGRPKIRKVDDNPANA